VNALNRLILLIVALLLVAVPVLLLLMNWGFIQPDVVDQYTGYRGATFKPPPSLRGRGS
jgi:hypothetical protein